jgi:hypothetical protein
VEAKTGVTTALMSPFCIENSVFEGFDHAPLASGNAVAATAQVSDPASFTGQIGSVRSSYTGQQRFRLGLLLPELRGGGCCRSRDQDMAGPALLGASELTGILFVAGLEVWPIDRVDPMTVLSSTTYSMLACSGVWNSFSLVL